MKKSIKFLTKLLILIIIIVIIKINGIDKKIIKYVYPEKYNEYVKNIAQDYDVDKYLIYAIIKAESNFKEDAISKSGAIGLMQVMEETAIETLDVTKEELYNPEINIEVGVKYYSKLYKKYNNIGLAIAAYNAGMGNVDKWIEEGIINEEGSNLENIPFKETNNYVRKILRDYEIYKKIYEE